MSDKINVRYLNNEGSGFSENCQVETGTTVAHFLANKGIAAQHYKVRLRRRDAAGQVTSETPTGETALAEGDFLSCVPTKAEGAAV